MSLQVAVIHSAPVPPRSCRYLLKELRERGVQAKYLSLQRISMVVGEGEHCLYYGERPLKLDGVLLRGIGYVTTIEQFFVRKAILTFLEEAGCFIMNTLNALLITRNKLETLLMLSKNNIPVPLTLASENLNFIYKKSSELNQLVLKPVMGSRGYGSMYAENSDMMLGLVKPLYARGFPLLVQRYVRKPMRDIRAFVIGGEVVASMYRYSEHSWKTNIAQGARGLKCELSDELSEVAIKATEVLGLEYAGVDIAEEGDNFYVLEVNGSPDFNELMKVSGKNIPGLIVEHFLKKIKA